MGVSPEALAGMGARDMMGGGGGVEDVVLMFFRCSR